MNPVYTEYSEAIKNKLKDFFALDLRSLALFRVLIALLIILDLLDRSFNLRAHYSDFGVLPRTFLITNYLPEWAFSFHLISGRVEVQAVLFIIAGFFALLLMIGYKTRAVLFISWLLLISLQSRNPLVYQGGDNISRLLCFWSLFLPLNACFSVDKILAEAKNKKFSEPGFESNSDIINGEDEEFQEHVPKKQNFVISVASAAFIIQMCFMYIFSVIFKTSDVWRTEGTAIYYALSLDQMVLPLGKFLLNFPGLLKILTLSVVKLEFYGPLLLFLPVFTAQVRTIIVVVFIIFHTGLGLSLNLGLFPVICIAGWLALLPGWAWDFFITTFTGLEAKFNYYYEKLSLFVLKYSPYLGYSSLSFKNNLWKNLVAGFLLFTAFLWNMQNFNSNKYKFPRQLEWLALILRLDQKWDMFSPYPLVNDGWFVIPGELKNGNVIDLFKDGEPVSWQKPENVRALFKGERWRKYFEFRNQDTLLYYGGYLCRQWNESHFNNEQLDNFEIYFMLEKTLPDNKVDPVRKDLIWKHYCFKVPDKKK